MLYEWDLGVQGGGGGHNLFFPKFNQIWVLSYSHACHVQRYNVFGPRPLGAFGRGQKVKYQLQSQFQRLLNQTLCVFPQMKDIKHVRRDAHLGGLKAA